MDMQWRYYGLQQAKSENCNRFDKTATADVMFGEDGKPIEEENFGENVIVVV
jgi:hypothetical protein